jgi:hypothetical protein
MRYARLFHRRQSDRRRQRRYARPSESRRSPYIKVARRYSALPSQHKSIEYPVSEGEIRASTYLASMFGLRGVLRQLLVSDVQCDTIPDSNFAALSGSNYTREDILPSRENIFVRVYLMT